MAFRYQSAGRECVARDIDELERALRAGEIEKTTPVVDEAVGARLQAGALIAMQRRMKAAAPAPAAAPPAARSRRAGIHPAIGVVVAFVIVLAIMFGYWSQHQSEEEALARDRAAAKEIAVNARRHANEMEALATGKPAAPPSQPSAPAQAPAATNDGRDLLKESHGGLMERIAPAIAEGQAASLKETREFTAATDAFHIETVLAPENVTSPEGRKRGHATIRAYLTAYEAHHRKIVAMLETHRRRLELAVEGHPAKAAFMDGVDKTMKTTRADYEEMLGIQRNSVALMGAIIDFVGSHGVTLRDGKLIFATQTDLDRFKRMAGELDELGKQEEAVRERQLARARKSADMMEDLASKQ
jgi:hypothetical protein